MGQSGWSMLRVLAVRIAIKMKARRSGRSWVSSGVVGWERREKELGGSVGRCCCVVGLALLLSCLWLADGTGAPLYRSRSSAGGLLRAQRLVSNKENFRSVTSSMSVTILRPFPHSHMIQLTLTSGRRHLLRGGGTLWRDRTKKKAEGHFARFLLGPVLRIRGGGGNAILDADLPVESATHLSEPAAELAANATGSSKSSIHRSADDEIPLDPYIAARRAQRPQGPMLTPGRLRGPFAKNVNETERNGTMPKKRMTRAFSEVYFFVCFCELVFRI